MSNDPKEPLLLDHNYDGIQELDNNLPRWWVWLFYITIIFSAVYLVYYHVAKAGDLQAAEYDKEMKAGDGAQRRGDGQVRGRHSHARRRPPIRRCWTADARFTPNSARRAIAPTAAASSART